MVAAQTVMDDDHHAVAVPSGVVVAAMQVAVVELEQPIAVAAVRSTLGLLAELHSDSDLVVVSQQNLGQPFAVPQE